MSNIFLDVISGLLATIAGVFVVQAVRKSKYSIARTLQVVTGCAIVLGGLVVWAHTGSTPLQLLYCRFNKAAYACISSKSEQSKTKSLEPLKSNDPSKNLSTSLDGSNNSTVVGWVYLGEVDNSKKQWIKKRPFNYSGHLPMVRSASLIAKDFMCVHENIDNRPHLTAQSIGLATKGDKLTILKLNYSRVAGNAFYVWVKIKTPKTSLSTSGISDLCNRELNKPLFTEWDGDD